MTVIIGLIVIMDVIGNHKKNSIVNENEHSMKTDLLILVYQLNLHHGIQTINM